MATPYWGQLPGPKVAVHTKQPRRSSGDYSPTTTDRSTDRRQSLDAPATQPQPKANRASVQTTNTDAPTDSTLSPFVSPTASSFHAKGLTPRPPSFPYASNQYPQEAAAADPGRRRRRPSRTQQEEEEQEQEQREREREREHQRRRAAAVAAAQEEEEEDEEDEEDPDDPHAVPPPAAPDVPRAPPVSYRHPYGNGGLPFTYPAPAGPPRTARRPGQPAGLGPGQMESEDFYRSSTPESMGREEQPVLDRSRKSFDPHLSPSSRRRSSGADAALGKYTNGQSRTPDAQLRKASLGGQTERQRKFEDVRSPLQKLELTLDSITKEEKRARALAAEQRAREKETRGPDKTPTAPGQQVRFRDRSTSLSHSDEKPHLFDAGQISPGTAAPPRGPLTQNPPEEGGKRHRSVSEQQVPRSQTQDSRIPVPSTQASGIPQRNLSFRERAERNDMKMPNADPAEIKSPRSPVGAVSLRGNKLRKEPPGDPWYSQRAEAEKKYPVVQTGGRNGAATSDVPLPGAPAADSNGNQSAHSSKESTPEKPRRPSENTGPVMIVGEGVARAVPAKLSKNPNQKKAGYHANPGLNRSGAPRADDRDYAGDNARGPPAPAPGGLAARGPPRQPHVEDEEEYENENEPKEHHHHISHMVYHARDKLQPGQGMYKPPQYLDEWKKATVGTLSGSLLDLNDDRPDNADRNKAWWEETAASRRRGSMSARPRRAEAFEGEYDEANTPTRFKPPLYLKCGPLLRYCGIRQERVPTRSNRNAPAAEREFWRGSVMIVTQDSESSYEIAPTLRMFLQPIDLLPPPPEEVQGPLPAEFVDPIVGHPKLGRKGETLYVRPVEHLEEGKDLSRDETDDGLFEKSKSPPDQPLPKGAVDPPGSFAARRKRVEVDGEKVGKYKDVRGFRLHSERGVTFWRFNIEVELRERQQRIAYRINRGPSTGFWVPPRGEPMNIMFYSCNGFSLSANPDEFCGPDPLWRDVLNTHQARPFHVMIGGGDQVYNDAVMRQTKFFQEWLMIKNPLPKHNAAFTAEMQDELENFYLERYSMWFSQGLFGFANSQIPMVNMYDDHDIIDGFGSYPHHFMSSPVFSGLGNVAFKYYMLFQHQSVTDETEMSEPSWTLGLRPGPYINQLSRSLFMFLGSKVALLAVDCRTERTRDEVVRDETWKKIMDRCYAEITKGKTEHLLVLLGVPIAYPRLVWLENILTSRIMDPIKALGKTGLLGNLLNRLDGGVEVLDDLDDHWTAKDHKDERRVMIEDLQDLAADKSVRVTILSGDVHLAAVGQFYSNPKLGLAKHKDFRYMPNVISSAIANTPPPDLMADMLNKRNKVHHFDPETEEDMIPLFRHGVEGKPRNNKTLLPHRNWCSIRLYTPGSTPPASPYASAYDVTPYSTPGASKTSVLRRGVRRGPSYQPDTSRPPVSKGLFRTLSRGRASSDSARPGVGMTRTMSLSRGDFKPSNIFRRLSSRRRKAPPDDGGINGQWGAESDEEEPPLPPPGAPANAAAAQQYGVNGSGSGSRRAVAQEPYDDEDGTETDEDMDHPDQHQQFGGGRGTMGLRGGAGGSSDEEFRSGDDNYFTARPRGAAPTSAPPPLPLDASHNLPTPESMSDRRAAAAAAAAGASGEHFDQRMEPRPFHRTPTGLSAKQLKYARDLEVNLEGGLEICLNVEVNQHDPAGITNPYRLVVPRLWYTYEGAEPAAPAAPLPAREPSGIKRWISLRRGKSSPEVVTATG